MTTGAALRANVRRRHARHSQYRSTGTVASSASNGRWKTARPRSTPATNPLRRDGASLARTNAAAAAVPNTNDSWYPSSDAVCTQVNGDATSSAAASTATRRSRVSSHANQATAKTPPIASNTRNGSVEPKTPFDIAISVGHSGWYLNTTRSSRTPERNGRKKGSCVAAGNVRSWCAIAFACDT